MRKQMSVLGIIMLAALLSGCMGLTSTVSLSEVEQKSGLKNITTGDGTFENYTAVDHVCAKDVGIAVGIPFIGKFFELFPIRSNEELLEDAAATAKNAGADSMINVNPATETYWGIPFFFVGLYVDEASGTGIKHN